MKTMTIPPSITGLAAALLAAVALCACTPPAPSGQKLDAADLAKVMPNATAIGRSDEGEEFMSYNAAGGKFRIKKSDVDDAGTYRITEDGRFCLKFTQAFRGGEYCYTVYCEGDVFRSVRVDGKAEER